jgi:hypothetical protein
VYKKKIIQAFLGVFEKKYYKLSEGRGGRGGREGGWRIVIPRPEAINFVDGRRQKLRWHYIFKSCPSQDGKDI